MRWRSGIPDYARRWQSSGSTQPPRAWLCPAAAAVPSVVRWAIAQSRLLILPQAAWHRGGVTCTRGKRPGANLRLLADHTEVTGDAEPLAFLFHPGVRETPLVLIRLPFERTFLVGSADDDDGIALAVKFHVIGCFHGELIGLVANRFQELELGQHRSIVVGEHEVIVQQFSHGLRVMLELHLVPEILECNDFCFVTSRSRNALRKGQATENEQEGKSTSHGSSSFSRSQENRRSVSSEDATNPVAFSATKGNARGVRRPQAMPPFPANLSVARVGRLREN